MSSKRPSDVLIAFAITVVRSKPNRLDIEEYIRLLRQHIAKGRRENALTSAYHHLDRSAYWRAQYEHTQEALKTAEEESITLRMEIESLKTKVETTRPASPVKKRKKPDEDTVPYPRSPKRARREASPTRLLGLGRESVEASFAPAGETGTILLRSVFQIHATGRQHRKTEPAELCYHLVKAATSLPRIVEHEIEDFSKARQLDAEHLQPLLTATARAITIMFDGLSRLSTASDGRVIFAVVKMFQDLLAILEHLAREEAEQTARAETSVVAPVKKSKSKTKATTTKVINVKERPTLALFTTLLSSIIDQLDPKLDIHRDLYEGFAYCVIDKLGTRLFTTVFGHARAPTLEAEILQSNVPDEIEDDTAGTDGGDEEQRKIKLEAPCLIHLLTRIMMAAPVHLGSTLNKNGKAKQPTSKGSAKGILTLTARDRLQRTLVNCVFGTEGLDEEDPFKDCLKLPAVHGSAFSMPKVKEPDVKEWFKEEVWRLLGWEILSKEGEW